MISKTKNQNLQAIKICNLPSKHLQKQDRYNFYTFRKNYGVYRVEKNGVYR
jgi:hypothetical protein